MNELKFDFTKDLYTAEKINIIYYRNKIKSNYSNKKRGVYYSEICKNYHEEKYNKAFNYILNDFYDIPKCPITNEPVCVKCDGKITFGIFKTNIDASLKNKWIAENNVKFISFVEKMKLERIGEGNPMFGKEYPQSGLDKLKLTRADSVKKRLETLRNWSDEKRNEVGEKMSKSRKENILKGIIGGMSGKRHSPETVEKIRLNTINKYRNGIFKQTDTSISRIFENFLKQYDLTYEKEFSYGHFLFDFRVDNYLFEIQGDYWHCNPKLDKYKFGYKKSKKLFNNIGRDASKRKEVLTKNEFILIEYWENDINKNPEKIELCLKKLFHLN